MKDSSKNTAKITAAKIKYNKIPNHKSNKKGEKQR